MYDIFRYFGKCIENGDRPVIIYYDRFSIFKNGNNVNLLEAILRKLHSDELRLKINMKTSIKASKQPFLMKAGMPSSPTDFDGLVNI
jgi:hypothetical protein